MQNALLHLKAPKHSDDCGVGGLPISNVVRCRSDHRKMSDAQTGIVHGGTRPNNDNVMT